ncbi:hypothetical protein CYMTET_25895 [Cymbomonas tetramitiformis]|uniref:DUF7148 domain-containing protein n=1 Tax=Cymbomonas tetramitiformis TaxID=36881 RepID=A0AAE0KYK7_9CHLO|nr:hypothetical protein CYMTET_25895 [Cymbomonas tetramitiformis]
MDVIRRSGLFCIAETSQLGTAKLPSDVSTDVFCSSLYQWASTLTTSGQNMPFALPQRVDRLDNGFKMSFLQSDENDEFVSVGEIEATVQSVQGGGDALIITGTGNWENLVDIPMVMQTMPGAIKRAIVASR